MGKKTEKKPPECWIKKHPDKPRKKLYGIWAKYNKPTKSLIETQCERTERKKKVKSEKK